MRRHAKAATAGSIKRQAAGLGRIFRGALAGRGACSDANGSGAPSHDRRPLVVLAALTLCLLVALTASVASGAVSTEFVKSFGPDGSESTAFGRATGVAVDEQSGNVYVLDRGSGGSTGALYKFAADGTPLPWGGTAPYIEGSKIGGLTVGFTSQVAVDSTSHVVYVTEESSLRAFQVDGEPAEFTAGPGAGTTEIPGFSALSGVAVDANGSIYASNAAGAASTVTIYTSTGEVLASFEPETQAHDLAVGSDGTVFLVSRQPPFAGGGIYEFIPSEFPVTTTTTYAAGKFFEPPNSGSFQGVDADTATGDLYALVGAGYLRKYDSSGNFVRDFGKAGEAGELGAFPAGIAVVPDGEEFQFYAGSQSQVVVFGEIIEPGPPSVLSTSATNVTSTSAQLRAEVNPNTFTTSYRFEYGLEDCATSACTSVPLAGAGIGSGHHPVSVSRQIFGLQPGTPYHYRVVAENSEGVSEGPDRILTTQVSGLGFELTDRRAWEMVSPPDKHGGSITLRKVGLQAAADGEGLAYSSLGSLEAAPEGNRALESATVLSRRGAEGWRSKDVTLPHVEATGAASTTNEYMLFTPGLSRALVDARDAAPLSPLTTERTPYLRENTAPPAYTPLLSSDEFSGNVPPGTVFDVPNLDVEGANSALTSVVIGSPAPLAAGAPDGALYRWSADQLEVVSELPSGEGGAIVGGMLGADQGSVRHAISEDGLRLFWGTGSGYSSSNINLTALYLRDTASGESVRLDVPQLGASGGGEAQPAFQGASADGTVAFFTDSRDLTEDSSPEGRDLYRCEIPAGASGAGCATLTNLSAPAPGESAIVKDMSPALSEDGSRIYFVAESVLAAEMNEEGDSAVAGEPNLYLAEEGKGIRFIATLSPEDRGNWGTGSTSKFGYAGNVAAATSPSGRYLAFMSERSLTGYDNRDVASEAPTEQAFRYDAQSGELVCVSCNPTGASPQGRLMSLEGSRKVDRIGWWTDRWVAAILPQANHEGFGDTLYRPRGVLDNGRVFFNAVDGLVSADSNGEWDVYQYEPTGVGDCTASSGDADTSRSAGGCVSLISSGTAEEEVAFMDASEGGDDVFFLTTARLSVTDVDGSYDVYDARVDGVTATLEPNAECLGEACQPAAQAPNDPTPASASFRGQGNQQARKAPRRRCARGKRAVKRRGKTRCVPRQRKQKRNSHRAGNGRRAGR